MVEIQSVKNVPALLVFGLQPNGSFVDLAVGFTPGLKAEILSLRQKDHDRPLQTWSDVSLLLLFVSRLLVDHHQRIHARLHLRAVSEFGLLQTPRQGQCYPSDWENGSVSPTRCRRKLLHSYQINNDNGVDNIRATVGVSIYAQSIIYELHKQK